MKAETIFERLWEQYIAENPGAGQIYNLFLNEGERVVNYHPGATGCSFQGPANIAGSADKIFESTDYR